MLNPFLREFWTTKEIDGDLVRFRVLHGGRASSKCLKHDTNVLMYDGEVMPINEILIGDFVMGWDGTPREVLDRCEGTEYLYEIYQEDYESYYVTAEHKLVLSDMKTIRAIDAIGFNGLHGLVVNGNEIKTPKIKVKPYRRCPYVGIEISGDRMFCLANGTVTHNSHDTAGMLIARANHRYEKVLCVRMYQNRIADSVYTLLKNKIEQFGLDKNFKIWSDTIENKVTGSIFRFYGCARNVEEIKSTEGVTIMWMEEAHNLTEQMFLTLRPTILRNKGAEMWFTFNPQLYTDYAYQRLVVSPPKGTIVKQINYTNNIFLNDEAIKDIEYDRAEDEDRYRHIYLGEPLLDDDLAIIKRTWVEASVDAHIKLGIDFTGGQTVGYDVADSGGDRNVATIFDGCLCVDIDSWKAPEDALRESALRAFGHVKEHGRLIYDSIGVGAHVGSTLKGLGIEHQYYKFNAGDKVKEPDDEYSFNIKNKDKFENRKAQAWQSVSDRLRNTFNAVTKGMEYPVEDMISISSKIPLLRELMDELCIPHRVFSKRGLDVIESKKDIKKRLCTNKSPDLADSFILGACPHLADIEALGYFDVDVMDWL